jgi:RNA polymerase sigma factor (sigma-70 family)
MTSALVPAPRRATLLPAPILRLVSDERLVEQIRAGSERAFEVLFDRHHGPLLAFCRQMLRSREDAEDAVQHTFLAAYRDFLRSQKPIAPRPWLFTIARNRCVSILRSQRARVVEEVPLVAEDIAAEVDRREDLRALVGDLARLPEVQRAALVLTELRGVPHDEIARILGCPQERVKALVFQARSSLAADRSAREMPCHEIRAQLATLRGSALRGGVLRRHLRACPGCREFREIVRLQRRQLGALLPVGPGVGLKLGVTGALFGSGGAGAGGATLHAGLLGGTAVARVLVGVAITGGGAGVTAVAHRGATSADRPVAPSADLQRTSVARARDFTVAVDELVPPRAGRLDSRRAETGPQADRHMPWSAGGVDVPEDARAGQDTAAAAQPARAAQGDAAAEPVGQPVGPDPAYPQDHAPVYDGGAPANDEQAPGMPPEPSMPAEEGGQGKGPRPAGSSNPPHAPVPASQGQSPQTSEPAPLGQSPRASGPRAAHPSPPVPEHRSEVPRPHANDPAAPAGQAPHANGQPHATHRGDDSNAAPGGNAKPPSAGPASPPRGAAAANHDRPAAPVNGRSPGAAAAQGGQEHASRGAGAPDHAKP